MENVHKSKSKVKSQKAKGKSVSIRDVCAYRDCELQQMAVLRSTGAPAALLTFDF
jgi:hypothetical protein